MVQLQLLTLKEPITTAADDSLILFRNDSKESIFIDGKSDNGST